MCSRATASWVSCSGSATNLIVAGIPVPCAAVADVRDLLLAAGVSTEEIDAAERDGLLLALLADRFLLPGPREYTMTAAAAAAGMPAEEAGRLWRALGFPRPAAGITM